MGDGVDGKYTIDAGEKLVRVQVWGELRATGLIKLMGRIASDPHYQGDMDAVIDLREAHGNWDYSEIQRLRDYVARIGGTAQRRWAAVVAPGSLVAAARVLLGRRDIPLHHHFFNTVLLLLASGGMLVAATFLEAYVTPVLMDAVVRLLPPG
ncbi:MAG: hypothetical protein LOD91_02040 [Limnochordales bacterium]